MRRDGTFRQGRDKTVIASLSMKCIPVKIRFAATLVPVLAAQALAVGVTLTYGSTNSVSQLELKAGETCEFSCHLAKYRFKLPGGSVDEREGWSLIRVKKDGLEWEVGVVSNPTAANFTPLRLAGPATLQLVAPNLGSFPVGTELSSWGLATFEVTPAPAALEKLVVVPEGQGARLVLEASTNLNSWAPIFSTVLTNVPANQFIRVRSEKAP